MRGYNTAEPLSLSTLVLNIVEIDMKKMHGYRILHASKHEISYT